MRPPGLFLLAIIGLAGCTSDFAGPEIEPGHPAHPDSPHAMSPRPPSPYDLEAPFVPLVDEQPMHDEHPDGDGGMDGGMDDGGEHPSMPDSGGSKGS